MYYCYQHDKSGAAPHRYYLQNTFSHTKVTVLPTLNYDICKSIENHTASALTSPSSNSTTSSMFYSQSLLIMSYLTQQTSRPEFIPPFSRLRSLFQGRNIIISLSWKQNFPCAQTCGDTTSGVVSSTRHSR